LTRSAQRSRAPRSSTPTTNRTSSASATQAGAIPTNGGHPEARRPLR
jgi:hypothetical protein